jgi:hypothetical protein
VKEAELVEDATIIVSRNRHLHREKREDFPITIPRSYTVRETWRVVDTDNFDGDYPNEYFVASGFGSQGEAEIFADAVNAKAGDGASRYKKVVRHFEIVYTLQPGFEP